MDFARPAIVVLAATVAIAACSNAGSPEPSPPSVSSSSTVPRVLFEISGVTDNDIAEAVAYFASIEPDPDGPLLGEGARVNALVGGCMESFGVPVQYAGPGGIVRPNNPAQAAREAALLELCLEAMKQRGLVGMSESDPDLRRRRYAAYLDAYECLIEHGVEVDPPPTLEAFVDGQPWSPFDGVVIVISEQGYPEGAAVECAVP
jgi:hypothetical protein